MRLSNPWKVMYVYLREYLDSLNLKNTSKIMMKNNLNEQYLVVAYKWGFWHNEPF